jgi:hypothetical protein
MTDEQSASIKKKISLILNQCRPNELIYAVSVDFAFRANLEELRREPPLVQPLDELGNMVLQNEHVHLLRALFLKQDDEGRKVVVQESARELARPECCAQVFIFLARYFSFSYATNLLLTHIDTATSHSLLVALSELLRCDHGFVSDPELDVACSALKSRIDIQRRELPSYPPDIFVQGMGNMPHAGTPEVQARHAAFARRAKLVKRIEEQVSRIQYLRLRKEVLESENFEINQDRDKLLDSLSSLGFSKRLTDFLRFAEGEFIKAQDAFSYKTSVEHIRSFLSELLIETAEKIARSRSKTLEIEGVDPKRPVQVREYLNRIEFLSDQFEILITGLYKFMSDEGTHTLGATKDVARIARNTTIEVGLLITKRVHVVQSAPSP